jgi:hypothetical protein
MVQLFPTLVYVLCFLASATCAILLGRSYWRNGLRLLFWSALCFFFLALTNLFVVLDMIFFPEMNFRLVRLGCSLAAVSVLLFGFLWQQEEA